MAALALVPGRHPPPEGPIATAVEHDVVPAGPYRLPGPGRDGVMVARDGALTRALWIADEQVVVRAWGVGNAVRYSGCGRRPGDTALKGIERMRFALGVDHDLSSFQRRFRWDPLIGPVIRRKPWLRPRRRPEPFEALAWAVCEQLIESGRAAAIQRRIVRRHGRRERLRHPARPALGGLAGRALARGAGRVRPRTEALDRAGARGARGGLRPRGPKPARARLAAPARDSEHRQLDARDAGRGAARAATTSCRRSTSPT